MFAPALKWFTAQARGGVASLAGTSQWVVQRSATTPRNIPPQTSTRPLDTWIVLLQDVPPELDVVFHTKELGKNSQTQHEPEGPFSIKGTCSMIKASGTDL